MLKCKQCEKQLKGKQKEFCSQECYYAHREEQNYIWKSDYYGKHTEEDMWEIIKLRVEDNVDNWIIVAAVDSQAHKGKSVVIETLTIYQDTKGGFIFRRAHKTDLFPTLRNKIYYEAKTGLALADIVVNGMLENEIFCDYVLHLDLGVDKVKCKTAALVPEIKGWVESLGHKVLFKPYSWGASSVSDKFSK